MRSEAWNCASSERHNDWMIHGYNRCVLACWSLTACKLRCVWLRTPTACNVERFTAGRLNLVQSGRRRRLKTYENIDDGVAIRSRRWRRREETDVTAYSSYQCSLNCLSPSVGLWCGLTKPSGRLWSRPAGRPPSTTTRQRTQRITLLASVRATDVSWWYCWDKKRTHECQLVRRNLLVMSIASRHNAKYTTTDRRGRLRTNLQQTTKLLWIIITKRETRRLLTRCLVNTIRRTMFANQLAGFHRKQTGQCAAGDQHVTFKVNWTRLQCYKSVAAEPISVNSIRCKPEVETVPQTGNTNKLATESDISVVIQT